MGKILLVTLAVIFALMVFVFPIWTACRFLLSHHQPGMACAACVVFSLLGGIAGFLLVFVSAALLLPAGHELIDMQGTFVSMLLGVMAGLPLGTWAGAWSLVWLMVRRQ